MEKVAESLRLGRSNIQVDPFRRELGFRSALTGAIDDFVPPKIERKQRNRMTDFDIQAYAAALEAIGMAGWTEEELRSENTGLILGNDTCSRANVRQADVVREEKSTVPIGGGLVFQALNSTASMNLNVLLGNKGACWTLSGACASGGHAVGQAAELIASGRQERMICGGVQEINWESVASFDATNAFSIREDRPDEASRPFDSGRDGLIPSGGVAVVLLEREDLARKRGADVWARVASYAFSSDGYRLAVPSGEGLRRCMIDCLGRARVSADKVDYLCAHGTSTPLGDAVEAQAIREVFGDDGPWVSSIKSMTGHEMWMAGAAQVVYSILMARGRFIARNKNFDRQEPNAAPIRIARETIEARLSFVLCNSAGFGGTNSCILLDFDP